MSETRNQSSQFSKKFRRGMAVGLLTAGAASGAVAHSVVDGFRDRAELPACDFDATRGGVDSASAALNKLAKTGADLSPSEVQVIDPTGRRRTALTDTVIKGSIQVQVGDRIEVSGVDPKVCIQAGGHVALENTVEAPQPNTQTAQQ